MAILTRETAGTGVTNNGAPLTNAQLDNNFIELVASLAVKQPLDADLTAIAGLTGTSGFLKKTAADTWSLDTTSYLPLTGGIITGRLLQTYGNVFWSSTEGINRPVSRKTYAEAGSIGTTGTAFTDVYGEADLAAIDVDETFTYYDAWIALETHGARMPTLAELFDKVGAGSGQGYDSQFLWTCTFAGPTHVYVAKGNVSSTTAPVFGTDYKIVDITDPLEVYRTRGFFDVSHATRQVNYASDSEIYIKNNKAFHDGYHPNADVWTTARTNTVTLTGDVTGTANASVDGSDNWEVSIATSLANTYDNYSSWTISDGTNSEAINSGDTLTVTGTGSTSVSYNTTNNTLTINSTDTNTNKLTTFIVEDGDGTEVTISHGKEWKFVEGSGIDINWTDTDPGSDADPFDLTVGIKGAEIPGSVDLNTYRTTGIYPQNANADALSGTNYPTANAGILQVINDDFGNGLHTTQLYSQYNSTNYYHRTYYNGNWTSWRNLAQDNNTIPNDATITISAGTDLTTGGDFTTDQSADETITIDHANITRSDTTSNASPAHGGTFTAVDSVTTNARGHLTAINLKTVTLPSDNNTDTLQTIANDTTDADRYVTFVNSATGAQTGGSNGNLRFNPSTGLLSATSKSFDIEHPTKEGMRLRYGSLEGPEQGVYVRGKLVSSNTIQLPDYWIGLVDQDSITVHLTPCNSFQKLSVYSIQDNTITIKNHSLLSNNTECFYIVYAERKDIDKLVVEYYR